ncbi:MAG: phosphate acetyltransferase [Thalassolituus oleivorans]|jgi:phosphate acetyltransferase
MLSTLPIECPAFLLDKASLLPRATTAVINAGSPLVLQSCRLASDEGLIEPVLIGDHGAIASTAQQIDWDISDIRIIHAPDDIASAQVAVALARGGEVASLMKGNIHTDDLLRAVINKQTGLCTGTRLSHVFHMTIPGSDQSLCITDAVINVLPSMNIQLDIARNVTKLMHSLGNSAPKIAVLSATEVANEGMPSSMQAAEVVEHAGQGEVLGAVLGGPFAFDNAVSPAAAKLKKIDHPVAGHADVLLVPNIETGNALFKQMVYFMSAAAAGVVLGAKVPIILTSRADPAAARLASTALASIYADYCVNVSA